MTSSLVGSEMCIRDSAKEVEANNDGHRWISERGPQEHGRPGKGAWSMSLGCLLYTSDAADDM
eukprot:2373580-Prorocentrum_lima.AAC.1